MRYYKLYGKRRRPGQNLVFEILHEICQKLQTAQMARQKIKEKIKSVYVAQLDRALAS
jgi:bifunctional DNase/RNase